MHKILVPTEFTYLSECALNLGVQLAKFAGAEMGVVSVVEPNFNSFMEEHESYSHDPTSSLKNIRITEKARETMHLRAEEISKMLPGTTIAPKIVYGNKVSELIKEVTSSNSDLVIIGGDLYDPKEKFASQFLRQSPAPVVILKCMVNGLDKFKDLVLLADIEKDSDRLIARVKELQRLLMAKIHVIRVNTPKNFLEPKKCVASLEQYVSMHALENVKLESIDAKTELEGLMKYSDTLQNAFICFGIHQRSFLERLISNEALPEEVIVNSVHPVWTCRD